MNAQHSVPGIVNVIPSLFYLQHHDNAMFVGVCACRSLWVFYKTVQISSGALYICDSPNFLHWLKEHLLDFERERNIFAVHGSPNPLT